MILDSKLTFASGTSVAASVGTALVGDVIDLDEAGVPIGSSHHLAFNITVATTFTSGGAATVEFQIVSDAQAAIATDGSATVHYRSNDFSFSDLNAGAVLTGKLPAGRIPATERYLGLLVVTGGATTTAGAINSELLLDAYDWTTYPDAQN